MSSDDDHPGAHGWSGSELRTPQLRLPGDAIELVELRSASIEHRLGYFRDEPLVIFGYCPGGGEVIWKDGGSSGFGTGAWRIFLEEIAPLATRRGANIGDLTSVGTHVLLMDRIRGTVYAVPRGSAEETLARPYGSAVPSRRCLCALVDCAACPLGPSCRQLAHVGQCDGPPGWGQSSGLTISGRLRGEG
jgi:hypothetical protein